MAQYVIIGKPMMKHTPSSQWSCHSTKMKHASGQCHSCCSY